MLRHCKCWALHRTSLLWQQNYQHREINDLVWHHTTRRANWTCEPTSHNHRFKFFYICLVWWMQKGVLTIALETVRKYVADTSRLCPPHHSYGNTQRIALFQRERPSENMENTLLTLLKQGLWFSVCNDQNIKVTLWTGFTQERSLFNVHYRCLSKCEAKYFLFLWIYHEHGIMYHWKLFRGSKAL